jgi:hypothetical protein
MSEANALVLPRRNEDPDFENGSIFFVGTATVLLRYAGFTILTDPNFLHRATSSGYAGSRPKTGCRIQTFVSDSTSVRPCSSYPSPASRARMMAWVLSATCSL